MSTIRDQIQDVIAKEPVALFMKGTPQMVMCGNSDRALRALREAGAPVTAVNVLPDPAIRQELQEVSGWPTIPQIFVGGELFRGAHGFGGEFGHITVAQDAVPAVPGTGTFTNSIRVDGTNDAGTATATKTATLTVLAPQLLVDQQRPWGRLAVCVAEDGRQSNGVLDGLIGALSDVRQHRVGGVSQQGQAPASPGCERLAIEHSA